MRSGFSIPTDMSASLRSIFQPTLRAVKAYWPAILLIQLFGLSVVIAYYQIEGTEAFFARIAAWKSRGGLLLSGLCTVVSGGIIPETLKHFFRPKGRPGPKPLELLHQFTMWIGLGMLIDLFYRAQNLIFGEGYDWKTLLPKILADQFLFTPLVSMPFIVSWFLLYENRYRLDAWKRSLNFKNISQRVLPLWASCLAFWPVMLAIVYSLPNDLQFPLFLFGNAAYSIMMIFIAREQAE